MVIAFDTRGYEYTSNTRGELATAASVLRFLYIRTDVETNDKLVIEIESEDNYQNIVLYVSIVMITISGLVIIYVLIVFIRYCLRRRQARIADPFQSNLWLSQANSRYERILNQCPEGVYDTKEVRFGEVSCAICLVAFQDGAKIRTLTCQHVYHKSCIEEWVKAKINLVPKCPACNVPITDERPPGYVDPPIFVQNQNQGMQPQEAQPDQEAQPVERN